MSDQPLSGGQKTGVFAAALLTSGRIRLFLASVLFIGWMAWLGYAALTKSRGPVVSHSQAAAATVVVVAKVGAGPDGKPTDPATVAERLSATGPEPGADILVVNLPEAIGFTGPGEYLLYLAGPLEGAMIPAYTIVAPPRSPGYADRTNSPPPVYPATPDVRKQAERLLRR